MKRWQKAVIGIVGALAVLGIVWFYYSPYFPTDVKILSVEYAPKNGFSGQEIRVVVKIKNNLIIPQKVYVESGIVPRQDQLSLLPVLGITFGGKCCEANNNYDGKTVILGPQEEFVMVLRPAMPTTTSVDACHNQGSYWKGAGTYYMGTAVATTCYGEGGWKVLSFRMNTITMR